MRGSQVPRILVVEDELMIVLMLESLLLEAGFEVADVATKVEAALAFVEAGAFDVAILDANLAGVSSARFCQSNANSVLVDALMLQSRYV